MVIFFPSIQPSLRHLLPKRLQEDLDTGSSGIIQETYAKDFPRLLRVRWTRERAKSIEQKARRRDFFTHWGFSLSIVFPLIFPFHLIT